MRKEYVVSLADDQRAALDECDRGPLTRRARNRVYLLLRADAGETDADIADDLGVSAGTAANVRRRFAAGGLDPALTEKPRPGAANRRREVRGGGHRPGVPPDPGRGGPVDGPPAGQPTGRVGGRRVGARGHHPPGPPQRDLKPWQERTWCLPKGVDGAFVRAMEGVLELYTEPHDPRRPVACFDEAGKELRRDVTPPARPAPGVPGKEDYEYVRHGTANPFVVVESLAGKRRVTATDRRTAADFAAPIKSLCDEVYPEAGVIRVVPTTRTPTPSGRCSRPSRRTRHGGCGGSRSSTTPRSTPVGWTWPSAS